MKKRYRDIGKEERLHHKHTGSGLSYRLLTSRADIVPVSGLVMNAFVRNEKELGTALELWDTSAREVKEREWRRGDKKG